MNLMTDENMRIKKEIYGKFAELGIGRTAIIFAQKTQFAKYQVVLRF